MELFLDIASISAITLIVYWLINLGKQIANNNENFMRFIPSIATAFGVILGVIIYFALPQMAIAENVLFAIIIGGVSGLAATGSNQIIKQLKKYNTDKLNQQTKE